MGELPALGKLGGGNFLKEGERKKREGGGKSIITIISSFCNTQLINPLGSLGSVVRQPQRTHRQLNPKAAKQALNTHNKKPESMDQKYGRRQGKREK